MNVDQERLMIRPTMIGVSLILLAIAANAGCRGKDQVNVPSKKRRWSRKLHRSRRERHF